MDIILKPGNEGQDCLGYGKFCVSAVFLSAAQILAGCATNALKRTARVNGESLQTTPPGRGYTHYDRGWKSPPHL